MSRVKYSLGIIMAVILFVAGVAYVYIAHYVQYKPEEEIELTAWYVDDDKMWKGFAGLVSDYNTDEGGKYGITVKVKAFDSDAQLYNELIKAIENDEELPDITACDTDFAAYLKQEGVLADLNKYFDSWDSSTINTQMLEAATYKGKLIAVPLASETEVFILNNSLFSDTDAIDTFEKLCTVSDEYYSRNSASFFSISDYSLFFRTASAQLGDDFDAVSPHDTDNENSKYIYNLIAQSAFNRGFCASNNDAAKLVADGELACAIVPSSQVMNYAYAMNAEEISFLNIPCMMEGESAYVEKIDALTLLKSSSDCEKAAASFLKWFSSSEINSKFVADSGFVPASGVSAVTSDYEIYPFLTAAMSDVRNNSEKYTFSASAEYAENRISFDEIMAAIMSSLN